MSMSSNHTEVLSTAATTSTRWRVRALYCQTSWHVKLEVFSNYCLLFLQNDHLSVWGRGFRDLRVVGGIAESIIIKCHPLILTSDSETPTDFGNTVRGNHELRLEFLLKQERVRRFIVVVGKIICICHFSVRAPVWLLVAVRPLKL